MSHASRFISITPFSPSLLPQTRKAATPAAPANTIAIPYSNEEAAPPVYGRSVAVELPVGIVDAQLVVHTLVTVSGQLSLIVLVTVPDGAIVVVAAAAAAAAVVVVAPHSTCSYATAAADVSVSTIVCEEC
jgi:hypothetical protein